MTSVLNRRRFIAAATTASLISPAVLADRASADDTADETDVADDARKPWLQKSFKASMLYSHLTLAEHFAEAKDAGFKGIEIGVPADDVSTMIAASRETGLIIEGSVGNDYPKLRHTDSDDDVRQQALQSLKKGIKQTGEMGGDSIQIAAGHGNDGTTKRTLQRAQEAIESALRVAEENKVSILVENVHNRMFYDPMGGQDQSADALAEFIDRFDSPWVGVQFDIANACKFGDPADWIRTLGPRIKKLDIKGFSRSQGVFAKIGGGDIDWPSVEAALREVNYTGWVAAEFGRSRRSRMKEISNNMESQLHCSQSLTSVQ